MWSFIENPNHVMYLLKLTQILISVSHVSHSRVFFVIQITEVRLPQDSNGRLKGFGYAEFVDKESLVAALTLNNEVIFLNFFAKIYPTWKF